MVGGQTEARAQLSSTIIDYHEPFDQGFKNTYTSKPHIHVKNHSSGKTSTRLRTYTSTSSLLYLVLEFYSHNYFNIKNRKGYISKLYCYSNLGAVYAKNLFELSLGNARLKNNTRLLIVTS